MKKLMKSLFCFAALLVALCLRVEAKEQHLLYVAAPGIRDYLGNGGHGILVFDADNNHKFVKRIPFGGLTDKGVPAHVLGICASAATKQLYVGTKSSLSCIDLTTDKILWEKPLPSDRLNITPDGKELYQPVLAAKKWRVLDAATGDILKLIEVEDGGVHNTLIHPNGNHAYLGSINSTFLRVADTKTREVVKKIGPFSVGIRPFTVNGKATLCFVNVNGLLGFEVGDLTTGEKLHRVEVQGFKTGPVKRHGCPSHGIGLTPDEKELWIADGFNKQMHYFDATVMPPKQMGSIAVRDDPGWVTFSIDGRYAYPSTGEVVDVATHKIVATLKDEAGRAVQSEKMLEIVFENGQPIRNGDQFGVGRVQ